jgi:hypothetical protein
VTTGKRGRGSFVEVSVTASPPQPAIAAPVRMCLSGGMTMEVTSGTDALWVAQVVALHVNLDKAIELRKETFTA